MFCQIKWKSKNQSTCNCNSKKKYLSIKKPITSSLSRAHLKKYCQSAMRKPIPGVPTSMFSIWQKKALSLFVLLISTSMKISTVREMSKNWKQNSIFVVLLFYKLREIRILKKLLKIWGNLAWWWSSLVRIGNSKLAQWPFITTSSPKISFSFAVCARVKCCAEDIPNGIPQAKGMMSMSSWINHKNL